MRKLAVLEKAGLALLCALFPFVLALASRLPIYTDEITYKMIAARYFLDGGRALSLAPQCVSDFHLTWPWFFLPFRLLDAALYADLSAPLALRMIGILLFLVWAAMSAALFQRLFAMPGRRNRLLPVGTVISFSLLGVLPFMMVINRPEQPVLLTLTAVLLLTLFPFAWLHRSKAAFPALICIAAALLLAENQRAIFFIPFLAACAWLGPGSRLARWLSTGLLALFTFQAYRYYREFNSCPLDPQLSARVQELALMPEALFRDPRGFAHQGLKNLLTLDYVRNASFQPLYMSDWIPGLRVSWLLSKLNQGILWLFRAMVGMILITCAKFATDLLRRRCSQHERRTGLLMISLLVCLAGSMFMESIKNAYQSVLVLPLCFFLFGLALSVWPRALAQKAAGIALAATFTLGLASGVALIRNFGGHARTEWSASGTVSAQPFSISAFRFSERRAEILSAARTCGLSPDGKLRHVLVDDLTYPVFWKSTQPYHAYYVAGPPGDSILDLRSFLIKHHSDGIIARCSYFNNAKSRTLDSVLTKTGDLCCASGALLASGRNGN